MHFERVGAIKVIHDAEAGLNAMNAEKPACIPDRQE